MGYHWLNTVRCLWSALLTHTHTHTRMCLSWKGLPILHKHGLVGHTCSPSAGEGEVGEEKLKAILGCLLSLKPIWDTWAGTGCGQQSMLTTWQVRKCQADVKSKALFKLQQGEGTCHVLRIQSSSLSVWATSRKKGCFKFNSKKIKRKC